MEFRTHTTEVRAIDSATGPKLKGYAVRWLSKSKPIQTRAGSMFIEQCARGCFTNALRSNGDLFSCVEHDHTKVISRRSAGTLNVEEDEYGLSVESDIDEEVSWARDLLANVRNGNVRSMSFSFQMPEDGSGEDWDNDGAEDEETGERCRLRTLRSVGRLNEVSWVLMPAYPSSSVIARSLAARSMSATVAFPKGCPAYVERRAAGIILASDKEVSEMERRRLALKKLQLQ